MSTLRSSGRRPIVSGRAIAWPSSDTLAWVAIIFFLGANLVLMLLRLANKPFNADELQHAHIAWTIAQGEVLYRDFWDHHGPLYNLMNGALIFIADPEPSLQLLFSSRLMSFAAMLGVMWLTWRIARELALSRLTSLLAVAAFSSLYFLHNKGVEARPDTLQSLFWVAGFYWLLVNQRRGSFGCALVGGALFTLAILSNAKAGIGPFFVVLFYVLAPFAFGMPMRVWWRDLSGMALGLAITMMPMLMYFYVNDGLTDFLYYNYLFSLQLAYYWAVGDQSAYGVGEAGLAVEYAIFFIRNQLPFVLLVLVGVLAWVPRLSTGSAAARRANALFLIATLGATTGWVANLFSQFFLVFLPLLAVFAAFGFSWLATGIRCRWQQTGRIAIGTLATLAAVMMLWYPVSHAPLAPTNWLTAQIAFTDKMVSLTERDEPVGVIWSTCGGYIFNRNVGYYWVAIPGATNIIEIISGEHPYGPAFIEQMEARQVRYVIGRKNWMTGGLTAEVLDYLDNYFTYEDCLWTRR